MLRQFARCFHTSLNVGSSSKSNLAKLRKKTGYTFANCKKALELHNNDVEIAEQWLKQQAQALGWSKATKLEGRATAQGMIGLALKNNAGVIVEVNCETDFVARNKQFQSLVQLITSSCLKQLAVTKGVQNIQQSLFQSADLKALKGPEDKPLGDHMALAISSLGENITLKRALVVTTPGDIFINGYTHPSPDDYTAKVMTGKYGALVAYTSRSRNSESHLISRQLCQHVVGMNPSKVGENGVDEPTENEDDEKVMIYQEFLLDPSATVGQILEGNGLNVIDFWRYECGEQVQSQEDSAAPATATAAA